MINYGIHSVYKIVRAGEDCKTGFAR